MIYLRGLWSNRNRVNGEVRKSKIKFNHLFGTLFHAAVRKIRNQYLCFRDEFLTDEVETALEKIGRRAIEVKRSDVGSRSLVEAHLCLAQSRPMSQQKILSCIVYGTMIRCLHPHIQ